jgi:hypothetical protein
MGKALFHQNLKELFLVGKVQVDRGWRVSDGAGESPHGKIFHAVADEDVARRLEDF